MPKVVFHEHFLCEFLNLDVRELSNHLTVKSWKPTFYTLVLHLAMLKVTQLCSKAANQLTLRNQAGTVMPFSAEGSVLSKY